MAAAFALTLALGLQRPSLEASSMAAPSQVPAAIDWGPETADPAPAAEPLPGLPPGVEPDELVNCGGPAVLAPQPMAALVDLPCGGVCDLRPFSVPRYDSCIYF